MSKLLSLTFLVFFYSCGKNAIQPSLTSPASAPSSITVLSEAGNSNHNAGSLQLILFPPSGPLTVNHNNANPAPNNNLEHVTNTPTSGPLTVNHNNVNPAPNNNLEHVINTPTEVINNGPIFSVTNPLPAACYFRLTKNNGTQYVFKQTRASIHSAIQSYLPCVQFSPTLNLCRERFVRVEVFSENKTICNFGATSPQNGDIFPLSLERTILNGTYLEHCNNNQECYNKKRVQLVRRSNNKFEFSTSDNNGFQGQFLFENNDDVYYSTSGMSNSDYVAEYLNHIL